MESPSRFVSDVDELHLFDLDSDIFNSEAHHAFLEEIDLLLEEVDDQERTQDTPAVMDQNHPVLFSAQEEQRFAALPTKSRKTKVPTLHESDWAPYKDRIVQLHILENRPLKEVREIMEKEFGFCAVIRQYRSRITEWKLDKNIKPDEMKAIVRRRQRRRLLETDKRDLKFRVRGFAVAPQKIDRWMKRNSLQANLIYVPTPPISTPSPVSYATISEIGSPTPSQEQGTYVDSNPYTPRQRSLGLEADLNVTGISVEQSIESTGVLNDVFIAPSRGTVTTETLSHPAWVADRNLDTIDEELIDDHDMDVDANSTTSRQQSLISQQMPDANALVFEDRYNLFSRINSPERFTASPASVPMTRVRRRTDMDRKLWPSQNSLSLDEEIMDTLLQYLWMPCSAQTEDERTFFVPRGQTERLVTVVRHGENSGKPDFDSGWLEVNIFSLKSGWRLEHMFHACLIGAKFLYANWSSPNTIHERPF